MGAEKVCGPENYGLCVEALDTRVGKLAELLREAEAAHASYERDREMYATGDGPVPAKTAWPDWYARYMIDNGLDAIMDHPAGNMPLDELELAYDTLALDG